MPSGLNGCKRVVVVVVVGRKRVERKEKEGEREGGTEREEERESKAKRKESEKREKERKKEKKRRTRWVCVCVCVRERERGSDVKTLRRVPARLFSKRKLLLQQDHVARSAPPRHGPKRRLLPRGLHRLSRFLGGGCPIFCPSFLRLLPSCCVPPPPLSPL
jgi:hypothetical protein